MRPALVMRLAGFAGGGLDEEFAKALAAQEEEAVADFLLGIVEPLPPGHFVELVGGNGISLCRRVGAGIHGGFPGVWS